mgnify:CR=1 FL=1|tara:strand:- start:42 stop:590 length:549 start_codon:yes stop_codon:yes gene_type:complete
MAAQLGAAALLGLAKAAARQAGVPLAKLTKKMIQNMNIPVRFKKLLQGPKTAGEKKIAPAIKSSVTMAAGEAKVGSGGFAAGLLTPTIVTSILSASKNEGKEKKKTKPRVTKPMGFASAAKAKQVKSSSEKAVKKAMSKKKAQPNVRSGIKTGTPVSKVKPQPRRKSGAPKKSIRPRMRPGS